ncbi:glycosyl hydrolase superfamily protein [Wolffia australiana]
MGTRKRERRISAARSDPPRISPRQGRSSARCGWISIFLFLFFVFASIVLLYLKAGKFRNFRSISEDSPILSVYERGLVKREITYGEVISENSRVSKNSSLRHFQNPILAYVTPWNSRGYELAEMFCFKLTHVSPVWYELKSDKTTYFLEGRHNYDSGWISRIKTNPNILVLPRVVLELFHSEMLKKVKLRQKVIDIIISECKQMGYDGIVLESWSIWAMHHVLHDIEMRRRAVEFVKEMAMALHSVNYSARTGRRLELIFVIPAVRSKHLREHDFGIDDFVQLVDFVDGFSLMTYDFSGPHNPGPNAPLPWIKSTLDLLLNDPAISPEAARKIFVGINFYGNDFLLSQDVGSEAITGRGYLSLLQKHKPALQWERESSEHFFLYEDDKNRRHAIFYPSLASISLRLDEARSRGASLSVWEIGQGLDYFFDLF